MKAGVRKGKIVAKRLVVQVEDSEFYVPKECDAVVGQQLEALIDQDVEVLMAADTVAAIRPADPELRIKIPPFTCYLIAPDIVFRPEIMREVSPLITKALVDSNVMDAEIAEQLVDF